MGDILLMGAGSPGKVVASSALATLDPAHKGSNIALDATKLIGTVSVASVFESVLGTNGTSTGKRYWEVTLASVTGSGEPLLGFGNSSFVLSGTQLGGADLNSIGWDPVASLVRFNNSFAGGVTVFGTGGHTLGLAADFGAKKFWQRDNSGTWGPSGDPAAGTGGYDFSLINAGPYYPILNFVVGGEASQVMTANFGQSAYAHTAPTGFSNW